jgi:hypothetical protein
MAEVAVLEKQDTRIVKPPVSPQTTSPVRPKIIENKLNSIDFGKGIVERVNNPEFKTLATEIGEFYKIPQEKIERALRRTKITENLNLDKRHAMVHDFINTLVDHGFKSEFEKNINGEFGNTRKAAAETLTLAFLYKNLSTKELLDKIYAGEIEMANGDEVKSLLSLMYTATPEGNHFTINDLADCYLQRRPNRNPHTVMVMNIVSRVKGDILKKSVGKLLFNDLKFKEAY